MKTTTPKKLNIQDYTTRARAAELCGVSASSMYNAATREFPELTPQDLLTVDQLCVLVTHYAFNSRAKNSSTAKRTFYTLVDMGIMSLSLCERFGELCFVDGSKTLSTRRLASELGLQAGTVSGYISKHYKGVSFKEGIPPFFALEITKYFAYETSSRLRGGAKAHAKQKAFINAVYKQPLKTITRAELSQVLGVKVGTIQYYMRKVTPQKSKRITDSQLRRVTEYYANKGIVTAIRLYGWLGIEGNTINDLDTYMRDCKEQQQINSFSVPVVEPLYLSHGWVKSFA